MSNKLPESTLPSIKTNTQVFKSELLNQELSKKQKSTLHNLIEIHDEVFPSILENCLAIRLNIDTLRPYAEYQLNNRNRKFLTPDYEYAKIVVPLDTPPKSTLTLIGRKPEYYMMHTPLSQTIENVTTTFNATKIHSWHTILDHLRPMLTHNISVNRMHSQYYNDFPH